MKGGSRTGLYIVLVLCVAFLAAAGYFYMQLGTTKNDLTSAQQDIKGLQSRLTSANKEKAELENIRAEREEEVLYLQQQIDAQKKLIASEQNILRINDLKIEVSEQLINLEDQAKRAKEYLEIQTQVKQTEIGLCKHILLSSMEKRKTLREDLDRIRQSAEKKQESEEKDLEELTTLREKHRELEREIDEIALKL